MKIISFNVGYFLGYDGTHGQYLRNPKKAFRSNPDDEKENLDDFVDLIRSEDADVVAVQEVDNGSIRSSFGNQVNYLGEKLEDKISFNCKYSGILANIPPTRNLGNSLIYNEGEIHIHRLSGGQKNLVQELKLEDFSLFSIHLATLGQWPRRRQIRSLSKIVNTRENFVIAGDWNTHNGQKEIEYAEKALDCDVECPGKTFPADNPRQKLDLVAHKGVDVKVKKMENTFSDHLPVQIEIN